MPIDTDDLSKKAYNAIIMEAEKFHHDLTLQFGLLSYDSKDEEDFIKQADLLIGKMLGYSKGDFDDIFFGNPPSKNEFHLILRKIKANIKKLKSD